MRPIYLFADSQLLFWKMGEVPFLASIRDPRLAHAPRAAYIGASNGDAPEYYAIFQAALEGIGVVTCWMIHSAFSSPDQTFLREADIVLLAGGDVERGWRVLGQTGMKELIVERYQAGATLIGVSAGAVQLGSHGIREREGSPDELFETLNLCPFVVIAHGEERAWSDAGHAARLLDRTTRAVGIPSGGGLVYHADRRLDAVRRPAHEFLFERGEVTRRVLIPIAPDVTPLGRS
ncbi:MAG: Type 1 glutamine amidotransferase-like domain-containing protein [Vicinamibacterales bacterium]